jgi:hypothetical protein
VGLEGGISGQSRRPQGIGELRRSGTYSASMLRGGAAGSVGGHPQVKVAAAKERVEWVEKGRGTLFFTMPYLEI